MDMQLPVAIRFGETEMLLEEVVKLGVGSVIELNSGMDQPVELVVNNRILARGEVVTVDGFYGIKITEITSAGERFKSLST
jgi:flagellar motor switch protein FliN/FliY